MSEHTKVLTSYANGTVIMTDAVATKNLLTSLAISTIAMCKEENPVTDSLLSERNTNLPHYDALIDKYCDGFHGAVLRCMLIQNVEIIYNFIVDCVLNETTRGLYLMHHVSKYNIPYWKLLILAIEEYKLLIKRDCKSKNVEFKESDFKYDKYNDDFEAMMSMAQ